MSIAFWQNSTKNVLIVRQNSSKQAVIQIGNKLIHSRIGLAIKIETDAATHKCFKSK